MTRAYICRSKGVCLKTDTSIDILFAFFGPGKIDFSTIADEIQNSLKDGMPLPDAVVFATYGNQKASILAAWEGAGHEKEVLESRGIRFGARFLKDFSLLCVENGQLTISPMGASQSSVYQLNLEDLLSEALRLLVEQNAVLQIAPSGHSFRHPSGKESKRFFLASELYKTEAQLYFVASVLVNRLAKKLVDIESIHIDTMGIYPIAKALLDVSSDLRTTGAKTRIESFHSYDGISSCSPSPDSNYLVLISASTSGSMSRLLHSVNRITAERIVTILDVDLDARKGELIYVHSKHANIGEGYLREAFQPQPYEAPIELPPASE